MSHSGAAVSSLGSKSHSGRSEPRGGCFKLIGKSEKKGALETDAGGKPRMSCCCPLLPCLQVLWKPLELGKKSKKFMLEKDHGHAPEKACADILCLESFSLSSAGDNLRGGFHQNIR